MKKRYLATVALFTVASGAAVAASISNLSGQSCGSFTGSWHFVNNQTGGAPAGQLTATWSSGDMCVVGPSAVNTKTQHFNCTASGTLLSASTNLPGKLVLSDFTCQEIKEPPPPPPCDPKTDPNCK
ncbi:MAG TPA: hypothetical protein VNK91_16290 [Burkholderiaceae bacterium]|nr:hypothetical protein [Burkholderiaceae bacterium]